MKISWEAKEMGGTTFHYASVGDDVRCATMVESFGRKKLDQSVGWHLMLPCHPYGSASGRANSVQSGKRLVEAEIIEWFERTGLL